MAQPSDFMTRMRQPTVSSMYVRPTAGNRCCARPCRAAVVRNQPRVGVCTMHAHVLCATAMQGAQPRHSSQQARRRTDHSVVGLVKSLARSSSCTHSAPSSTLVPCSPPSTAAGTIRREHSSAPRDRHTLASTPAWLSRMTSTCGESPVAAVSRASYLAMVANELWARKLAGVARKVAGSANRRPKPRVVHHQHGGRANTRMSTSTKLSLDRFHSLRVWFWLRERTCEAPELGEAKAVIQAWLLGSFSAFYLRTSEHHIARAIHNVVATQCCCGRGCVVACHHGEPARVTWFIGWD